MVSEKVLMHITLICLTGKAERSNGLDKGGYFSVLLTDQQKAFDCIPLDLIITKVEAQGFKNDALCLTFNYSNYTKQIFK